MPAYQQEHSNYPPRLLTRHSTQPRQLNIKLLLPNETGKRERIYRRNYVTPKKAANKLGLGPATMTYSTRYEIPYSGSVALHSARW